MNLIKRTISGIFLIATTIFSIYFNDPYYYIFIALIGIAMSFEWERMMRKETTGFSVVMAGMTSIIISTFQKRPDISLGLMILATVISYIYFRVKNLKRAKRLSLGYLYINIPLCSLAGIMFFYEKLTTFSFGMYATLWLFSTVWASDTGGYIFGCLLKGPKLAPKITPKKTWAGFFGGIILSVAVCYLYMYFKPEFATIMTNYTVQGSENYINYYFLGFTAFTSVVSQMGDLFESFIKRKQDIKDSGTLIPGHGGVFDRFDGLLFAATSTAIALLIWYL